MELIQFTSTLKPDGKEYKKVVYWNRFVRMKLETVILALLFIAGIFLLANSADKIMFLVVGALFVIFPIIIIIQLNSSIRYHLENRDKLESMPCTFTIMTNGILTDIREADYTKLTKWEESDKVYNAVGYYMFFKGNTMTIMVDKSAIPDDKRELAHKYITDGMRAAKKNKKRQK